MQVEIWSDIVCPWCYIGKRRFEAALARFARRDQVTMTWRSFELDARAPRHYPGTLDEMLARKMGVTNEQAAAMNARMTDLAAAEGLEYHLDRAQPGNTFDAHRLLHLAAERGTQGELKERLMRAYFTEGRAVGDPETLAQIAAETGIDVEQARAVLAGDAHAEAVRADERRAAAFGISGVPFFVIDERYGVSGAQPTEVFIGALEQAWAASHPFTPMGGDTGNACDGESCPI
jgi:predicted DsbA family dithiol-disulfide isomerase